MSDAGCTRIAPIGRPVAARSIDPTAALWNRGPGPCRATTEVPNVPDTTVNVRYIVDDVDVAIAFYTTHLGFVLRSSAAPAFADVTRGPLRLLLSGPTSSGGRPLPDGRRPEPGGWNRIHFVVDDLEAEVARLRAAGVPLRSDIVTGPGGSQVVLDDPSGNPVELFQPASGRA
jgi:catechol 2,3-dioxygenase-like lactoylglutathione lyase family enzyme